jgi:hypothetical protein
MGNFQNLKMVVAPTVEALRNLPSGALSKKDAARLKREATATDCVALLLGSFRKCDADVPEIFSQSLEHVLARYDVDIQKEVIDPGQWKFPPTAYELREACEKIAQERHRAAKREAQIAAQLAGRRGADPPTGRRAAIAGGEDERKRREAEQILARYAREAGQANAAAAAPSVFEIDPNNWNA